MRFWARLIIIGGALALSGGALAQTAPTAPKPPKDGTSKPMEVTADQSLEYYQDQHIYVARGHAKAVRGEMIVEADLLKAHEIDKGTKAAPKPAAPKDKTATSDSGDIDRMEADGNVRITDPKSRTSGDHAVYDVTAHTIVVTGNNLRYETEKQTVTAKDSLEYYEDKKMAVARGHAVEVEATRHIEGDVLVAEFADDQKGQNDLTKVTADGHVFIVTKTDTVRGDKAVYEAARDVAVVTGHVQITRPDGTQISGDIAQTDFKSNQSRILNSGHGRVRALLPQKSSDKATSTKAPKVSKPGVSTQNAESVQ